MNVERLLSLYERIAEAPDAIARLRRFILDLAVRGKLVPQDSNDEPASELLKRIAMEKARLVGAAEIRKPRPLPAVDEPPFDLPQNWRWTRVREVASDRGQEIPQATFTYIDVTAIDKEAGVVADPKVLKASEAPSRARKITRKGDVIYSCVRPYLLNVAVIDTDFDPKPIASTAFAILNGHGLVLPRYLWIVLRSPFMVECVEQNQRGQAYPAINDADFAVLPFPLSPLAEQHRIVVKVDELMGLCDRLEAARAKREGVRDRLTAASLARLNAPDPETFQVDVGFTLNALPAITARPDQIKQLRQTILNLAVRGKLVPQDPTDEPASELLKRIENQGEVTRKNRACVGDAEAATPSFPHVVPYSWTWTHLERLALKITDGEHLSPNKTNAGMKLLTAVHVRGSGLSLDDPQFVSLEDGLRFRLRCDPKRGDILVCSRGTIGRCAVVETDEVFCLMGSVILLRLPSEISPRYLLAYLSTNAAQTRMQGMSGATAVKALYLKDIRNCPVPLPPVAEQHRIVAKVDALMALCDQLEASVATSDDTRRRLLDALLAEALGPVKVRELEAAE